MVWGLVGLAMSTIASAQGVQAPSGYRPADIEVAPMPQGAFFTGEYANWLAEWGLSETHATT